ncbi:arylesterase [Methylocella sp.]|uniref:arylesterase n=1 Tax=Methylocella sp. TaxID=1978226 RepID=UPI003782ED61
MKIPVTREAARKPAAAARRADEAVYGGRRRFLQISGAAALASALGAQAQEAPRAGEIRLLALGDSLTAGYMLPEAQAFPAALEAALRREGFNVRVVNAGVSGDTASGGLARLDWTLGEPFEGAIVELGANDMLRGIDPATTRAALAQILDKLRAKNIKVLLAGMLASGNLDDAYRARFNAIYPELAAQYGALLYPFFLEGVSGRPALTLADGLHPNAAGVETIVRGLLPQARALMREIGAPAAPG